MLFPHQVHCEVESKVSLEIETPRMILWDDRPTITNSQAFQSLLNATFDAILIANDEGHYVEANPAACQLFGLQHEQLVGRSIRDFVAADFDVHKGWQTFLAQGQDHGEFCLIRGDGTVRQVEYTATANFVPHRHLSIFRDVTPQKAAQTQIRTLCNALSHARANRKNESEAIPHTSPADGQYRLQQIAHHIPGVMYQFCLEPDGTMYFPYVSEGTQSIYGISPETVEENCNVVFEIIHPEDLPYVSQSIFESAKHLSPWYCEYRINHPNGSQLWLVGNATPQQDDNGRIIWYGYIQDITDQKVSQLILQASENKFRNVIENINDMVFTIDPDGTFGYVSPAFKNIMGYEPTDLSNQLFSIFIYPEDLQICLDKFESVLNGEKVEDLECRIRHEDGHYYWHRSNLSPLHSQDGDVESCLGIASYIDNRKQSEIALRESKARLDFLLQGVGDGIWDWNMQTNTINYSPEWLILLGCDANQPTQNKAEEWENRLHPDDRDMAHQDMARYLKGETPYYQSEHRLRCEDGTYKWILSRGQVIERDEQGNPVQFIGLFSDISERKANEAALENLTNQLKQAQQVAHIGHWSFDLKTQKLSWSDQVFRIFGISPNEPEPTFTEHLRQIHPEDQYIFEKRLVEAALGIPQNFDYRGVRPNGEVRYINSRLELEFHQGQVVQIFGTAMDVTERKVAELELERFFTVGLDLLCIADTSGRFHRLNRAWEETLGYNLNELKQQSFLEFVHPEDVEATLEAVAELRNNKEVTRFVNRYRDKQGSYHYLEWVSAPYGEVIYAAARDITSRLQVEAALKSLASRSQLLNSISDEIRNSLDLNTILQNAVNAIVAELQVNICTFGWYDGQVDPPQWQVSKEQKNSELASWIGVYHLDEFPKFLEHVLNEEPYQVDIEDSQDYELTRFCKESGVATYLLLPLHTTGGKIGGFEMGRISRDRLWEEDEIDILNSIVNQVTIAIQQAQLYEDSQQKTQALENAYRELQETQVQLIQAEKMSSLGQLVGGVAHELNNPVSFVYGNLAHVADYAQDLLHLLNRYQDIYGTSDAAIADCIEEIDLDFLMEDFPKTINSMKVGAERIRDIVKSLRTFSRLDEADFKEVNLHENLDSTLLILQNRLNGRGGTPEIEVIKDYGNLPKVACYSGLLNQVFMNLLINAIDAIEEQRHCGVADRTSDYHGRLVLSTRLEGEMISIQIEDNGIGILPQVQEKIFNPFFTTKPIGSGTGMGLSTSYQIITQNHKGQLYCTSVPGQGSCFMIRLPR
ncbi:PAS domain-containing sensor histidine kinase [Sodalinema gerasimenkoae]|uniref:PAS domain-containing sensor histidine kinase n=1 Tax=Sodalinema gerasimenkoae TaxID=2862348 RepID=UPI001358ADC5|nr:PAS domain-containing protein [Sodalinema gerasimenkoae]